MQFLAWFTAVSDVWTQECLSGVSTRVGPSLLHCRDQEYLQGTSASAEPSLYQCREQDIGAGVLVRVLNKCVDHNKLENSERDGNTRPHDLPLEKFVCRSGSNS